MMMMMMAQSAGIKKSKQWFTSMIRPVMILVIHVLALTVVQPRQHTPAFVLNNIDADSQDARQVMGPDANHNQLPFISALDTARADFAVPVYTTCSAPGSFALTFDDGPSEFSSNLDGTLDGSNSKASFFINGNNFGCIYDYAERLVDRFNKGHLIASHTWSHVHSNEGTYDQIAFQLELIENAMIKILGVKPLYFRPPYGEYNEVVLQVLQDRGYRGLILWSEDSGDSLEAPPSSSEIIESYRSYPDQTNVLNHETQSSTVNEVIPNVIPILKDKGYDLQTVPHCLNLGSNPSDWYVSVQPPGSRDETWTCDGTPMPGSFE
ncbi:hypothetical protein PGT21_010187 [Puccinia graminis f. sp. tritici]|uniref:NodB homology domain-containing protein n=1 Tax=Puccinia graminis f. sp. tritici TaxID=56615 RepID=A0A5B0N253_PUCGR|nr:hypothetical protein PGT21_010187 [Puccinia graminis f. sp. tritici]KAA1082119.1 hypothetical protein PGTUg99_021393 [Puccinia graminis f. sp. tritici]